MIQQQMKELNELRTRKKVLVSAMAQIIDTSAPQGLTEEQVNAYQAHKEQLTDINGRLRTFEDMAALELPRAIRELPDSALAGGDSWQQPASRARGRRYRDLFPESAQAKNDGGFQNFAEFLSVLHSGRFDERLNSIQISATMSEGIGSAGGFLVPEEFSSWLLDTSLEDEIVRPRATVYPMLSATRKVPGWDGQDHSTSLFGGFTGTWLAENGSATEVDPKLRLIELTARKLACFTKSSNELIADGLGLEQQLTSALVRALGWYLDLAFLTGTGA
jgi:HK97 family phage major capsid protein